MTGAAEAVRPVRSWPYQYLKPIIMGVAFCGCVPHEHAQCETWINYRISRCNFIADGLVEDIYCGLDPSY